MYCTLYFHFPWHALPAHGTLCYLWQTFFWQPAISIVCKWEGCRTRQKPLENGILEVGGSLMEAMRHLFAACIACSILHWTFYGICTSSNVLNWLLILMEELKIAHTRRRLLNREISIHLLRDKEIVLMQCSTTQLNCNFRNFPFQLIIIQLFST